jgi:tryptophan synthase alpha subunit
MKLFFLLQPCQDSQRFLEVVWRSHGFIYAISFQSVNGKACGSKVDLFMLSAVLNSRPPAGRLKDA